MSADQFIQHDELKKDTVSTESGTVLMRGLTAAELLTVDAGSEDMSGQETLDYMINIIMLSAINQDGTPFFSEQHREGLMKKSQATLEAMLQKAFELSGAVEKKNLPQTENSPTD